MIAMRMPRGADALSLATMNMGGRGKAVIKHTAWVMGVPSPPELIANAPRQCVGLIACSMSMGITGITAEELIGVIEFAAVGGSIGTSENALVNLFI
jgi:peroxiredoxin family protein